MNRTFSLVLVLVLASLLVGCSENDSEPVSEFAGDWRHAGGDHSQAKYSPLDQINAENFVNEK